MTLVSICLQGRKEQAYFANARLNRDSHVKAAEGTMIEFTYQYVGSQKPHQQADGAKLDIPYSIRVCEACCHDDV